MSTHIAQEAGFARFVCPFAYRLACGNGVAGTVSHECDHQTPSVNGIPTNGDKGMVAKTEGRSDNGDVGSGDKLLHLLQKWDIQNTVLTVTRIDGGFVMAELLGVRRCVSRHTHVLSMVLQCCDVSDSAGVLEDGPQAVVTPESAITIL